MKILLTLLCLGVLVGCTTSRKQPIDVSREKDLGQFVGKTVVVRGKVTNTKCPYINGIDMWELERLRGEVVEATGLLESWTVTTEDIRKKEEEFGGPFAHRGPGTFFRLKNMKYRLIAEQTPAGDHLKAPPEE